MMARMGGVSAVSDWQAAALLVLSLTGALALGVWLLKPPSRYVEIALIGLVALALLGLGVYHSSHQGVPSGIIELSASCLLAAAATLAALRR